MSAYENELSDLVYELNTSTSTAKVERNASLDALLVLAAEQHASDILLVAGSPVTMRVNCVLNSGVGKNLSIEHLLKMLLPLFNTQQSKELEGSKSLDFCFAHGA